MNWLARTFNSTLGKKLIMSLTGLFLITFLVVHASGNMQLFNDDQGYGFNTYTKFMTSNKLIKTVSYLLYTGILVHAIWAFILAAVNKKARPVGYAMSRASQNSKWASRNMTLLGTVLLIFIVVHMQNFWYQYKFGTTPYIKYEQTVEGDMEVTRFEYAEVNPGIKAQEGVYKDLYTIVTIAFQQWWLVALYVISMVALAFHLSHGFASAFQTLGIHHSKYTPAIKTIGVAFSIIVPALFASMPIYFFIKSLT